MSKTIQSKGELWLPQDKFDNRDSSNTLEEGVEYNIIDSVGYATAQYVDDKVSTKTSVTVNGSNVATFNADTKITKVTLNGYEAAYTVNNSTQMMRTIDTNHNSQVRSGNIPLYADRNTAGDTNPQGQGVLITSYPQKNYQCANKLYVDNAISSNALSAGAGITIADKIISLDYDTLNSDSISSSNGHLSVNTSYIVSNICGNGLYVDGCNSVLSVNWESIPIDVNSPMYFGSCNQGLNLTYGNGLKVESCNGLCVDWSSMPVDSSTFYVDSCNGLQIQSYNNLLNIGLYDYNGAHIYMSSNNLDIYSSNDLYMAASSSVLLDASNYIRLQASNSILLIGDKSSYGGCNFPLDAGLWLKDTCGIGMLGNFGGIYIVGDKKIGIEIDSSNNTNVILINGDSLIEATSSHLLLQYGSNSGTSIEINANGVYIGGVKYGA